jgi:hypothetical protein
MSIPSRYASAAAREEPRMEHSLEERLAALPSLSRRSTPGRICKICGSPAPLFDIVDFNKICSHRNVYEFGFSGIQVPYYRCGGCDFLFTDLTDDWSTDDFSRFIYNDDYLKVDGDYAGARAVGLARHLRPALDGCQSLRILDYGSGAGGFAEEMKSFGFAEVVSYDPFSARQRPEGVFDLITCFEVVEHSPRPLETLGDMTSRLAGDGAILVGQTLQPENIESIRSSWWYLAPRNGHVSTYSEYTFMHLAARFGLEYYRGDQYIFARARLSDPLRRAVGRIGARVSEARLFAPAGGPGPHWHEHEKAGQRPFRWSASANLTWPPRALASGAVTVRIPFLMQITDGFAASSRVFVGGSEAATVVEEGTIVAKATIAAAGRYEIVLRTPLPVSPKALGTAPDERRLGLAIPVAPEE